MEDLAQQVMEAEDQSCKSAKSLFQSEAFVFIVYPTLWAPSTQNTKPHDIYSTVYTRFNCWMSNGIVSVTVSSVQYVYIYYRKLLSSDCYNKEPCTSFNVDCFIWAQNYASVVVGDY